MTRFIVVLGVTGLLAAGCASGVGVVPSAVGDSAQAAQAAGMLVGRALVDVVPLADAEVTVYDPVARLSPAAPGSGDGVRVEWAGAPVRTRADGTFSLPLTLKAGQVAEIYVTDGKRSVCAIVVGPMAAVRTSGKVPLGADAPLVVDLEATSTTAMMLNSLKTLGQVTAMRPDRGAEAVLALRATSVDAMAAAVGPTAAKLHALADTVGIATSIAEHMRQADPRLSDDAAKARRLFASGAAVNPVLTAFSTALVATGAATPRQIGELVSHNDSAVTHAVTTALGDQAEVRDALGTALTTTAAETLTTLTTVLEQLPAPPGASDPTSPTAPTPTPAHHGSHGSSPPGPIGVVVTPTNGDWVTSGPITTTFQALEELF